MSLSRHGHHLSFACCAHCHTKPCLHHKHRFQRHALIALGPHHRVPHACPVWMANASNHEIDAFVRSLTEPEVHEALHEVRRAHHHTQLHHVTKLNARAQLGAALHASRHAHLLLWTGTPVGTKWGKSGGRIGSAHKEKKGKEEKDQEPEEEEKKESGRLVGIELECQHAEGEEKEEKGEEGQESAVKENHEGPGGEPKRKRRWAEAGEVLSVVPKATGTDTVKLKAKTERDPDWINWTGKGWKGFSHQGEEYAYKVPGFGLNSVLDLLPEGGIWGARTPPKFIEVEAKDQDGRTSRAKIAVYPDHMCNMKGRIGEKHEPEEGEEAKQGVLGKLLKAAEKIGKGLGKIPLLPGNLEFKLPEGAWHLTMGFQEDKEGNDVFMLVDLGAGFDPLASVAVELQVPMTKLLEIIPEKLREYVGDIRAYFELEGKVFLNVSVGRLAARELNAKGEIGGIIGASLNFDVQLGASILKVIAKAGTEIKPEGLIQRGGIENQNELKVYWQLLIEFGGMTGSIAWEVWDGKFTHENTWRFLDPQTIYESPRGVLF